MHIIYRFIENLNQELEKFLHESIRNDYKFLNTAFHKKLNTYNI